MIERIVVQITIYRFLGYIFSHFLLDEINFFFVGLKIKNWLHFNCHKVHSVFEHHLLFLYLRIHEVSCEKEANMRVESFFSYLFHKTAQFKYINFFIVWVDGFDRSLNSSIIKSKSSWCDFKEYVLSGFSWALSFLVAWEIFLLLSLVTLHGCSDFFSSFNLELVKLLFLQASWLSFIVDDLNEFAVSNKRYFD